MPERHDNTIYKLSLGIKKIIKVILSSMTRIRPIIRIEDPKEAPGVDYVYIEENTKENIVFGIKSLVPIEVLTSIVLYYITRPLYLRACALSYD